MREKLRELISEPLCAHGVGEVRANVEEDADDIVLAVCYEDHGDDFLYIRTKDGKEFKYGWYINRPFGDSKGFVRRPEPGIAGKISAENAEYLFSDEIQWVCKDGRVLAPDEYFISYGDPDEWGVEPCTLVLDQFDSNALEKVRNEAVELKLKILESLDDLNLDTDDLSELLTARDLLEDFYYGSLY